MTDPADDLDDFVRLWPTTSARYIVTALPVRTRPCARMVFEIPAHAAWHTLGRREGFQCSRSTTMVRVSDTVCCKRALADEPNCVPSFRTNGIHRRTDGAGSRRRGARWIVVMTSTGCGPYRCASGFE